MPPPLTTLGQLLHWSYANLAMAHAAVTAKASRFGPLHFMIRSRLHKGLQDGTMNIGSLFQDERLKMVLPQACAYCGSREKLTVDHLVPRIRGGGDRGENLVWACRACNSAKGSADALSWLAGQGRFPPLLLLRRYLKLALEYAVSETLLDVPLDELPRGPFAWASIPRSVPGPAELVLWTPAAGG